MGIPRGSLLAAGKVVKQRLPPKAPGQPPQISERLACTEQFLVETTAFYTTPLPLF